MSAAVASARGRGRAHRDPRDELLHEGDAGADGNVLAPLRPTSLAEGDPPSSWRTGDRGPSAPRAGDQSEEGR